MSSGLAQLRCLGVAVTLVTAPVVAALVLWERLNLGACLVGLGQQPRRGARSLDDVVAGVAAAALVVVLAGLAVSVLLTVIDVLAQQRWRWLHRISIGWCPTWSRRLVVTLCGVGMALPATAASWSQMIEDEATAGRHVPSASTACPFPTSPRVRRRLSTSAHRWSSYDLATVCGRSLSVICARIRLAPLSCVTSMPGMARTPRPSGLIPT